MNFNRYVFLSAIVAALGGFLFGFDTAVISGAEQEIQRLWQLTDLEHGLAVAIALYGTVLGALFGGIPANAIGRKQTLFWVGILYLVSAIGSALAPDEITFMIFRFIGGVGVGASSVAAPMYISEISPAKSRGTLVALFQFNIVLGIVIAYVSNYLLSDIGDQAWRSMLGVEAVPALIYCIMVTFVPKSPRWLIIRKNAREKAMEILQKLDPEHVTESMRAIIRNHEENISKAKPVFFSSRYKIPIMLAIAFAFFNQMAGINAIIYYAPRIFEMAGLETGSALLSTTGIGITNLIFTMLGIVLIDRTGRKRLMLIGSLGLILMLGLVARSFYLESFTGVPLFLFTYIAFFAMSQGAVIWVFISEIFPNEVRAQGQSLGSFTHWIMAAIVANIFPGLASAFGGGPIFLFFTIMMILQLIFVIRFMPETKGKSLEELESTLMD
ncbi:sugar porter family MFS transporter [Fulvivirga sedimenti]|uniref:Sugar porter family MFS transporter n=1 Tax=Fulvivirga sedimenti TaxID=2879465 RepID=A0A9X1HJX4_9BACT|nr:sugar porter family MFS transporter [Fulvivirga sedimenti]MCA6073498.1 sugar porter family MFS transporter [Fulvivirga sedimenti]